MNILVACEESGRVREAFRARGHNAWSCDLLPARDGSKYHFQKDIFKVLEDKSLYWDMLIAFPPCTYLCSSGLHWNKKDPTRALKTGAALNLVLTLAGMAIPKIVIENSIGCLSTRWRKPDQIIQPYQFGEDASKATCLWLKGVPKIIIDPKQRVPGRLVMQKNGKLVERWSNQTDSGQNRLGPSATRGQDRGTTYEGVAKAFAGNWG